jgi:hypothetical protein
MTVKSKMWASVVISVFELVQILIVMPVIHEFGHWLFSWGQGTIILEPSIMGFGGAFQPYDFVLLGSMPWIALGGQFVSISVGLVLLLAGMRISQKYPIYLGSLMIINETFYSIFYLFSLNMPDVIHLDFYWYQLPQWIIYIAMVGVSMPIVIYETWKELKASPLIQEIAKPMTTEQQKKLDWFRFKADEEEQ